MDYRSQSPEILRDFLAYHETIRGHSRKTVDEYFLDLRNFFRYIKIIKGRVPRTVELEDVDIMDVDLALIRSVTLTDIYEYMGYLSRDRVKNPAARDPQYGLNAASRARKVASIRSFYKYLTSKAHLLDKNPMEDLDSPRLKQTLPRYLSLEESVRLLESVEGANRERDYCILTLFLNCGLRISELVGLNCADVREDSLRVLGKGNKERILYLNDACMEAISAWRKVRDSGADAKNPAFFLSRNHRRISTAMVHALVKKHLSDAGLDSRKYSSHKLRHTAATLMLKNGVDVKVLQEVLGHEHLNTTQIYTHVDNEDLHAAARANPLGRLRGKGKK